MRIRLEELCRLLNESTSAFDPEEFEALGDDFNAMHDYLEETSRFIAQGAGRRVYDIGSGEVIKLAYNRSGRRQNRKEASISSCASSTAPIVRVRASDRRDAWIVCDAVEPIFGDRLNAVVKATVGLKDADALMYVVDAALHPKDADPKDAATHERLYDSNEWYSALVDAITSCKLNPMELHSENWGLDANGDLVLLDAGD